MGTQHVIPSIRAALDLNLVSKAEIEKYLRIHLISRVKKVSLLQISLHLASEECLLAYVCAY